jgi:hypothetical protein
MAKTDENKQKTMPATPNTFRYVPNTIDSSLPVILIHSSILLLLQQDTLFVLKMQAFFDKTYETSDFRNSKKTSAEGGFHDSTELVEVNFAF